MTSSSAPSLRRRDPRARAASAWCGAGVRPEVRAAVCVAVCLAAFALSAPSVHAKTVALAPLPGAQGGDGAALLGALRAEIAAREGVRVQPERDTAEALVATTALEGECDLAAPSCLARVAVVAVVDEIVGGSAIAVGSGYKLRLMLVSARGDVVRRAEADVPGSGQARADALRRLAIALLQPDLDGAFLRVFVDRPATLILDGQNLGDVRRSPILSTAGRHRVEIVALGYETEVRDVELRYGEIVELRISPRPLEAAAADGPPDVPPPAMTRGDAPNITIAVLGFESRSDDARIARWLTNAIVSETRKRERVAVVDREACRAQFGPLGDAFVARVDACAGQARCLTDIAATLGVDAVFVGYSARTPDGRLVYVESVPFNDRVVGRYAEHKVVGRKLDHYGTIVGSSVSELLPDYGLATGERAGVSPAQRYALDPPPVPGVIFLGTAGVAGVSALAAGGLGAVFLAGTLDDATSTSVGILALSAVGAALGAGAIAAVMLPFTDWGPPEPAGASR